MDNLKVHLLVIDPQNDFCAKANPALADAMLNANNGVETPEIRNVRNGGALYVDGADADMKRLTAMIDRLSNKLEDIHVTLDSHRTVDIAHSIFWINSKNEHPNPSTVISVSDVENGTWRTTNPGMQGRALDYVRALDAGNRYALIVWPNHCIIGTWGHSVYPEISNALLRWEENNFGMVDYVTKGSNPFTEHYSAVKADVEDPEDVGTQMNTELLDILAEADIVPVTGQALSHCVCNTVLDIIDNFGAQNVQKLVLLEDTCSNVTGFEQLGDDFIKKATNAGMRISTSVDFMK
jgi:nicotinamidase-related amidase